MSASRGELRRHQERVRACRACPRMLAPPVTGEPVASPVLLVGQAPGRREREEGRPFAWTAGRTLFGWFARIGVEEAEFRQRVYMAAVCRCFPGKTAGGGDRAPDRDEVRRCAHWLDTELDLLRPRLILPAGRLAISRLMAADKLTDVVGRRHRVEIRGFQTDVVPLPHPSGASPWHKTSPGRELLQDALGAIDRHPAWGAIRGD